MRNKNETNALLIGLGLIISVMLITFFRSNFFAAKNIQVSNNTDAQNRLQTQKYQTISPSQLQKKMAMATKINLLDIRSFNEFITEHIVDSINVSTDELPLGSKIDAKLPTIIITTDATDENIEIFIKSLQDEHISDVQVLAGGMNEWKKMAGPTVSYGDPKSFVDQSKVSYVQAEDLNEALKNNVATFVLDVRNPQEFSSGHIKGAVNIPFDDLEKRRNELGAVPRMVVTGINELQEFEASVQLYDMIFTQPFVLKDGISGWQKKGFELVK